MPVFRATLANYFGPLDFLLVLVQRGELDVLDLALSEVAAGCLAQWRGRRPEDLEEAGAAIALLAALLELKSRAVLPEIHAEADPAVAAPIPATRTALLSQIADYRRFQEAAELLAERAARRRDSLRRLADDLPQRNADPAARELRELEVWDLVAAFGRLLKQNLAAGAERVARDPTPIAVYQERLAERVAQLGRVHLLELLGTDNTRAQLIGKFLAALELVKQGRVWVEWDAAAGDLLVLPPRAATAAPPRPAAPDLRAEAPPRAPALRLAPETEEPPVQLWPDLPAVPEFARGQGAWTNYRPLPPGSPDAARAA